MAPKTLVYVHLNNMFAAPLWFGTVAGGGSVVELLVELSVEFVRLTRCPSAVISIVCLLAARRTQKDAKRVGFATEVVAKKPTG